jgi:hypothetical protein
MTNKSTAPRRTKRRTGDDHQYQPRRRLDLRRRRRRAAPETPPISASAAAGLALHHLIEGGDFLGASRRGQYLVAFVSPDLMELISVALAATEDVEPNGDLEPSIDSFGGDDLEADGLERGENDSGWCDGIGQGHLHCDPGGTCDDEDGDPSGDPLDRGEYDDCDAEEDYPERWTPAGSPLTFSGRGAA